MRKTITLLTGLLFFVANSTFAQRTIEPSNLKQCGTEVSAEQIKHELSRDKLKYQKQIQTILFSNITPPRRDYIIQLHLVRTDDGTGAGATAAQIRSEIANFVNPYFNTTTLNASFVECGPELYHNSTDYYNLSNYAEGHAMANDYNVANVINIYFVNNPQNACGWARFPADPEDYIVIAYGCATNQSTLVHELGHYFDVYHTHETAFGAESVTRNNADACYDCDVDGDLLCDTDADPTLNTTGVSISASPGCAITNMTYADACGGVTYTPDPTNIMSYSLKACRTVFTSGQEGRMAAAMANDRTYLTLFNAPVAIAKNISVNLNSSGTASIAAGDVDNGSTAGCGIASLSVSPSSFNCGDAGPNTVTLTVTDNGGNTATTTSTVTVVDNINPQVTCPGAISVQSASGQCGANVSFSASASDNCAGVALSYSHASGSFFPVGLTVVNVTATDASGNTANCSFSVTVIDMEAPTITCPAPIAVANDPGQCNAVVTFSPTVSDNCSGATVSSVPASGSTFAVGTTTVISTATDAAGNTATCSFDVTVNDTEAPEVLTQNTSVILSGGNASILPANVDNGSSDNCAIASMSVSPSAFKCDDIGSNPVTLTVTDIHGNTNTGTALVDVVGAIPTLTLNSQASTTTYTGGGMDTTIILGYGSPSLLLEAVATGGMGGTIISYSWVGAAFLNDPASATPVFTPTVPGDYTYFVTVENNFGCQITDKINFKVIDARCGKKNNKVIICHDNDEICVSPNAVQPHLLNHPGDFLGPCDSYDKSNLFSVTGAVDFIAYPTPSAGLIHLEFEIGQESNVQIEVLNVIGQLVYSELLNEGKGHYVHSLDLSHISSGMYLVRMTQNGITNSQRIQIQK